MNRRELQKLVVGTKNEFLFLLYENKCFLLVFVLYIQLLSHICLIKVILLDFLSFCSKLVYGV